MYVYELCECICTVFSLQLINLNEIYLLITDLTHQPTTMYHVLYLNSIIFNEKIYFTLSQTNLSSIDLQNKSI